MSLLLYYFYVSDNLMPLDTVANGVKTVGLLKGGITITEGTVELWFSTGLTNHQQY